MKTSVLRTIKQFTSKEGIEGYFAEKYDKFAKAILTDIYKEIVGLVTQHLKSGKLLEIGPAPDGKKGGLVYYEVGAVVSGYILATISSVSMYLLTSSLAFFTLSLSLDLIFTLRSCTFLAVV